MGDKKTKNGPEMNKAMFVKKARLVYKIEVDRFYEELFKDLVTEDFGWYDLMSDEEKRECIVRYELNKLRIVILQYKITATRFYKDMSKKEDIFCNDIMGFLPKKRRVKLWKKLKKDKKKLHL